jgi:hypothetical protein
MNPPWMRPSRALQAKNEDLPESQNWDAATIDHKTICVGIHRSGPIHFETNCEGNSAKRKLSLNTVFPQLKSAHLLADSCDLTVHAVRVVLCFKEHTIRIHPQVWQKVIRDCLVDVGPVKL